MKPLVIALCLCLGVVPTALAEEPAPTKAPRMTQERLESLLRSIAPEVEGIPGVVAFRVEDVQIECISDRKHDRMRLVAAIRPVSELTAEQVGRILEANFHTALDARYATSHGTLYAAFIHPLGPLTESELRSAVSQVASLARTFGTTYSGGRLVYEGPGPSI